MVTEIIGIIVAAILSQNFILVKFYGICPFMGVSKKIDTALGMGMAVTFVMALASAVCWLINELLVMLGVSEETAAADACKLEHAISDESFQAIKAHASKYTK